MLSWQLDRVLRAGPLCAVATFVVPVALAIFVSVISDVENVFNLLMVASGIIALGGLTGSVVAAGLGSALFGLGCVVAEVPAGVLAVVGIGLFTTFIIQDLAGSLHRAPRVNTTVWKIAAITVLVVAVASAAIFAVTFLLARLTTWQTIVVPFGIGALGLGAKLAADSHVTASRQLTAKRTDIHHIDFED